ncbi:hypothetical protein P261_01628 [Lachnospiraceae bacterium TWA4]|nr:hypothetical protein P261_01628 [Lachnospiraceae bacterium TWA4]
MSNKKKLILNTVFLFAVFGLTIYYIFHGQDLGKLAEYMKTADIRYWLVGVVLVVCFICSESVIIFYMMKSIKQNIQLTHCFLYSFVGFFFSCITPSATGGQPAQIYFMKRDKLPISISTLVLMIVTITYKLVLVVIGLAVVILRPESMMSYLEPVIGICYLGLALNVFCVTAMLVLVFHPTLATDLLLLLIRVLGKFGLVKRLEEKLHKVEKSMKKYQDVAVYFSTHKRVIVNVFLITFVQRVLLFFVTALVYFSFSLSGVGAIPITFLQGMISVSVDMLPLPGGMGISETLFNIIFTPIFGTLTLPGMIVSRGLSYYTQLIISAIMTVVAYFAI